MSYGQLVIHLVPCRWSTKFTNSTLSRELTNACFIAGTFYTETSPKNLLRDKFALRDAFFYHPIGLCEDGIG